MQSWSLAEFSSLVFEPLFRRYWWFNLEVVGIFKQICTPPKQYQVQKGGYRVQKADGCVQNSCTTWLGSTNGRLCITHAINATGWYCVQKWLPCDYLCYDIIWRNVLELSLQCGKQFLNLFLLSELQSRSALFCLLYVILYKLCMIKSIGI